MTHHRVLFASTKMPYPLSDGAAIRQFHVLRGYAKVASVKLLTFLGHPDELNGAEFLRAQGIDTVALPITSAAGFGTQPESVWRRRVEQALSLRPLMAAAFRSPAMRQMVQRCAPSASLVHAFRLWAVPNLESTLWGRGPRQRFVLDLDDVETVTRRRILAMAPAGTWRRRMFEEVDLLRLGRYQAKALARSDSFFVCSRRDQTRFTGGKAVVIPNGATVPVSPLPELGEVRTILAVGLLSYEPNVSGLRFFVREIFPLIRSALPDVRLLVVGRNPTPEVLALHDGRTIEVAANVLTMEPYYRQAALSVVPLLAGGGTRLRILESFAMGRAVVATPIGCEGLDVINGEHLLVANDAPRFAEACIGLLREPQRRRAISTRARRLVEQEYTWDAIETRVALVAERLLTRGSR